MATKGYTTRPIPPVTIPLTGEPIRPEWLEVIGTRYFAPSREIWISKVENKVRIYGPKSRSTYCCPEWVIVVDNATGNFRVTSTTDGRTYRTNCYSITSNAKG